MTRRRAAALLAFAVIVGAALALRLDRLVSFDRLVESRAALRDMVSGRQAMSLGAYVGLYALYAACALPGGALLTVAGGFLFGATSGALAAAAGATTGAVALFSAARALCGDWAARRAGGAVAKISAAARENAVSAMLFLRLSPVFPFWLVNLAAAGAGVPLSTFAWTTAAGVMPAAFVFAFAGADLDAVVAASEAAKAACRAAGEADCRARLPIHAILSMRTLAALVALSLIALLPAIVKTLRRRSAIGCAGTPGCGGDD